MPQALDVIKVGNRYQVYDQSDNSPIGPTYPTRKEAEEAMYKIQDDEYAAINMGVYDSFTSSIKPELAARNPVEKSDADNRSKITKGRTVGAKTSGPQVS